MTYNVKSPASFQQGAGEIGGNQQPRYGTFTVLRFLSFGPLASIQFMTHETDGVLLRCGSCKSMSQSDFELEDPNESF